MKQPIEFTAYGTPKGQPRVRAFVRGKHAGVYDPGTAEAWKNAVRAAFPIKRDMGGEPHFTGPVGVNLQFRFPRPKSHYKAKQLGVVLKENAPRYHTSKPDADNAVKAVLDALDVCRVWRDDAQVSALKVSKFYVHTNDSAGCNIVIYDLEQ